jgi:hypothetical protein
MLSLRRLLEFDAESWRNRNALSEASDLVASITAPDVYNASMVDFKVCKHGEMTSQDRNASCQ